MSYIPTAPDLKTGITAAIRAHRKRRDNGGKWFTPNVKERQETGRYTAVGGALVTVTVVTSFSANAIWGSADPANAYEHRIEVDAIANCHGHGCIDPEFTATHSGHWLLADDADVPAERAVELARKAREWAQAHAEKCRAQAYTN